MMKRVILTAVIVLVGVCSLYAQSNKIDEAGIRAKIESSNEDIENPKKNLKAATWLNRSKVFTDAAMAADLGWFAGLEPSVIRLMFGPAIGAEQVILDGVGYDKYILPAVDAYLRDGKVMFWDAKLIIEKDALQTAYDAAQKAYELDPKSATKVRDAKIKIIDGHALNAQNRYALGRYSESADAFHNVYDVQLSAPINLIDTASLYKAGHLYTIAGDYEKGAADLEEVVRYGYDNGGDLYYFLFHCYFGQKDMERAEKALVDGFGKYPGNTRLIEGLIGLYTTVPGKDPSKIIQLVEETIEKDPENPILWAGLGQAYDKLGNVDKSIEAFVKSAKLSPNSFASNFNLGYLYIKRGDVMLEELNDNRDIKPADYKIALANAHDVLFLSIAPLEKAHAINPASPETIELLKNVTYVLRTRDAAIAEKYTKYYELLKAL